MFSHAWETGEHGVFAVLGILQRFRKGLSCNERIDLVDLWRKKISTNTILSCFPQIRAKTSLDMKKRSRASAEIIKQRKNTSYVIFAEL